MGEQLITGNGVPLFYKYGTENEKGYIEGDTARNLIKWLFNESSLTSSIVNSSLLGACLSHKKDKIFNIESIKAIQEILDNTYKYFTDENHLRAYGSYLSKDKELQLQNIIDFGLSYIPFFHPKNNSSIYIPQKINNNWQRVEYKVERIQITHKIFGSPYYAYGLKPINNPDAQAQLLFMGTNPLPTATGRFHTFMTDFLPGFSAGEHLYLSAKGKIQKWVEKNATSSRPVVATGMSLGGSLAGITHFNQPDLIQARAINPPTWLQSQRKVYEKSKARLKAEGKKAVNQPLIITANKRDPVFEIGTYIPGDAMVYRVISEKSNEYSCFTVHREAISTHFNVEFQKICPVEERTRIMRKITTAIWQILSVPIALVHIAIMAVKVIINSIIMLTMALAKGIAATRRFIFDNDKNVCVKSPILNTKHTDKQTEFPDKIGQDRSFTPALAV